jgi:hypothetical protein
MAPRRYQRSDISGRVKTTETKVEMKMHKVIYMKPGSGFILDNRTNNSVKGPEHVRTPRHVRKASARGESRMVLSTGLRT